MSVISSTFTDFDENVVEDEYEVPEMKFTPVVKTEVPDGTGNVTEEDIDDNFIQQQLMQDDGPQRRRSNRVVTRGSRGNVCESKMEESPRDKYKEWSSEEEDWALQGQKRKSRSRASKRSAAANEGGGSSGASKRQSSTERRQGAKERMLKLRAKRRDQKASQGLVENKDKTNVKVELEESEKKSRNTSRRKGTRTNNDNEKVKEAKPTTTKWQRMTPEQREKDNERRRRRAQELKNVDDPEILKKLEEQRLRAAERKRLNRALLKETKSEKMDEQTAKSYEKKPKASTNDAERRLEEMRERERERKRKFREMAKQGALPEDRLRKLEIQKEKDRERKRARRAAMTPEQKKIEAQKNNFYRISRMSRLPEEEKRALKIKEYMQKQAKLAEQTPEERERREEKLRERARQSYHKRKHKIDREKAKERQRQWWHGMDPEKKKRYQEMFRDKYRKRMERLKEDPEKYAQERNRENFLRRQRKQMIYVKGPRKSNNTEEKKRTRKRYINRNQKKWSDLTEDEKDRLIKRNRETELKKKLAIQKLLDSGMTMEQIKQQTETPGQRERRCIQMRIRKAKMALRRRLENMGATPEEIKERVEELVRTYQPKLEFRPYKPRIENWKPVDPNEVAKLAAEGKLDDLEKVEPLTFLKKGKPRSRSSKLLTPAASDSATAAVSSQSQLDKPELKSASFQQKPTVQNHQQQPSSIIAMPTLRPRLQPNYSQSFGQSSSSSPYHQQYPSVESSLSSSSIQQVHQQLQPNYQPHAAPNIVDGLTYQHSESGTGSELQQEGGHYDNTSTTSSQHEYTESYHDTDNYDDAYSPASPAGSIEGGALNDHPNYVNLDQKPTNELHSSTTTTRKPRTTNSATKEKNENKPKKKKFQPYRYLPSKNPNAKLRGSRVMNAHKRTIFCDQCPQSFTLVSSLEAHKKQLHNPNYDIQNRICRICGETFKQAQVWFSHYYNTHVRTKELVKKPKPIVCDLCGSRFMSVNYLNKHQYYKHGEGQKEENRPKCQICQKSMMGTESYNEHLLKYHPEYDLGTHECNRCDKTYSSGGKLRAHVKEHHPESYFPCPDCPTVVRFSKLGLIGHLRHGRCSSNKTENKLKLKGEFGMDQLMVACELCNKEMVLRSLKVHYRGMHGAKKEELFLCSICQNQKKFKDREFYAIHLEERHRMELDEIKDIVRMINVKNREEISVKPLSRRGRKTIKPDRGADKKSRRKGRGRSKRRNSSEDDDETSETEDDDDSRMSDAVMEKDKGGKPLTTRKKKRRKITVIAEEDEMESEAVL